MSKETQIEKMKKLLAQKKGGAKTSANASEAGKDSKRVRVSKPLDVANVRVNRSQP